MEFEYEETGGRIRIVKCRTDDSIVTVPETIDGKEVTELGKYALSGHGLGELELPRTIRKIGAYAMYNCWHLEKISFYSTIEDIGPGVFTGCTGVKLLDITVEEGKKSCFREVLSELRQTLYVRYHGAQEARLIFPEFYEESVENTPARITSSLTHGCGHRYRYCFADTQFQFRDYDSLFPHARAQEDRELLAELAMGRLQYPSGLTADHRSVYEDYLGEQIRTAGEIAAGKMSFGEDTDVRLRWLTEHYVKDREVLDAMAETARKRGNPAATSYLMDYRHDHFPDAAPKRKRFEL